MSESSRALRLLATVVATGLGLLCAAAPAAAHVRVDDGSAPSKGGYGIVRLIVPTESATTSTVGLTIIVPKGVDLAQARTLPISGWTSTVETEAAGAGQRVSKISWRAVDPAQGLKPSEFGEFTFSAGPWPTGTDSVALPSEQTYSDGSVVSWNESAVDKDSEPEHPAPTVALSAAEAGHAHTDDDHASAGSPVPAPVTATASGDSDDHHAAAQTSHAATSAGSDDSWFWRGTSVVSLVVALGTAAALALVLRRTRGAGS